MAVEIPPSIKKKVQAPILRAHELEKAEPIISYYCKYYAIQQILSTGLHHSDPQVADYATHLLDDIETMKTSNPGLVSEDAREIVGDEIAAQAYVESFATKVFSNADHQVHIKKTTRQTASAFIAASVFFEVLKVFNPQLDEDVLEKIKYSKYHAARILKTYKEGGDPNDYEPEDLVKEEENEEEELKTYTSATEVNDDNQHDKEVKKVVITDISDDEVDEYGFKPAPSNPPSSGSPIPSHSHKDEFPKAPSSPSPSPSPISSPSLPPPPIVPTINDLSFNESESEEELPSPKPSIKVLHHHSHHQEPKIDVQKIIDETEVFTNCQKHAKFAISALNYEDIKTAKKELLIALDLLNSLQQDGSD